MEELRPRKYWPAVVLFGLSVLYLDAHAPVHAANINPHGPYLTLASNTFIFNPRALRWKAVQNGKVIRTGKASGGSKYCSDIKRSCKTPSGTYRIISKGGAGCRSSRYPLPNGGAKMPYCMFYSKYYAIHGSYDVPNYNASHGCIRVTPGDALWLHRNFIRIGTKVVVLPY
ncbi:enhanced entry protein EnhA [Legionella lansingensis]|uniref:Enhanced entry protein EnhA n=1 Tax=Legionella lansingensis TaxID=45067 RepID=A0A0W0VQ61_9GAMM|nr:L,D-transpeptidase [Legionella lansingensis]KTD22299.1 enhanced entry protein EnhA [Legionella lansingensis]SNV50688.1 enhanced entry protein EnhA [Legionella lansingensis]